jgi:hypothetical protein
MKNYILVPFLSLALIGATNVSVSAKEGDSKESKACCSHDEFHCSRAWKKELKRTKKEYKAKYLCDYRPFAAERKMRKACKKAWKRDMIEHDHVNGYERYYWF